MLTFDKEAHKYSWNGIEVPGVSEIIRATGQSKDWSEVPGFYRERGEAVHLAIRYYLEGSLDEESLDPVIRPYFDQFKAFLGSQKSVGGLILSENPYYSQRLDYAGTLDLVMNGAIWDIKCTKKLDKSSEWQYNLQGAAYRHLAKENGIGELPFRLLILPGEGAAKEYPLVAPLRAWENVIELYNIKHSRIPFGEPSETGSQDNRQPNGL